MYEQGFVSWFTSGAPAIWLGFFMLAGWYIRMRPVWKQRITEARLAEDQIEGNQRKRLSDRIATLEDRCDALEQEVQDCHRREATERAGRLEAEAMLLARSRGDQEAQVHLSAERLVDRSKRES